MMRYFFVFIFFSTLFSVFSCNSGAKLHQISIAGTYTAKRKADSFVVKLEPKLDTVFLYYFFTFKDGNFLNYPTGSSDYAGFFTNKDVKKGKVIVSIKDYRQFWNDSSKVYDVSLDFLSDTTFHWYIDSVRYGILDFLPHNIVFLKKRDFR